MVDMVISGRWRTLIYGRYGHIRAVAHIYIWYIWSYQGGGTHFYMVDMVISGRWHKVVMYGSLRAVTQRIYILCIRSLKSGGTK